MTLVDTVPAEAGQRCPPAARRAGRSHYAATVSDETTAWEAMLVSRLMVGDDAALAIIYDQYSSLVYGIARRLVGEPQSADVTQQVFLRLWERPDAFDASRGSLRTFLAVLARRRAIDHMRSTSRARQRDEKVTQQQPLIVPNVDEAAMAMIASERVRTAVTMLPAEQRHAVELAYFDGLTFRQVAVATGVAEGTAKSRLRLALNRLAAYLAEEGSVELA